MTTIAYRDGVLASDTAVFSNGIYVGQTQKIFSLRGGSLLAVAGDLQDAMKFKAWVEAGCDGEPPKMENLGAFVIHLDGFVTTYDNCGIAMSIEAPFYAEGSGADVARGAMAAGASAEEAVRIASTLDSGTRGPLDVLTLNQSPESST